MSELREIKTLEATLETIYSNDTVLIEFGAAWCGPCKAFLPHFTEFAKERDDIVCVKVDVDTDPGFMGHFDLMSVPQVMLYKNGEYVRHVEARTIFQLRNESL